MLHQRMPQPRPGAAATVMHLFIPIVSPCAPCAGILSQTGVDALRSAAD